MIGLFNNVLEITLKTIFKTSHLISKRPFVFRSSSSAVDHYVDIIFAFNKKYFDNLRQWMNAFVQQDNFPSPHVTKEQKHNFSQLVLRERVNKRKLAEIVREFTLVN